MTQLGPDERNVIGVNTRPTLDPDLDTDTPIKPASVYPCKNPSRATHSMVVARVVR
jgi:hypothetical protein